MTMNQPKSIEISAPDIEAAIDKGIAELGVSREEVMVEVLEEPGRRLLGLGARQAKVRLTVIRAPATPPAPTQQPPVAQPPVQAVPVPAPTPSPKPAPAPVSTPVQPKASYHEEEDEEFSSPTTKDELAEDAKIGAEALQHILDYMQLDAVVQSRPAETSDDEPQHWTLEIQGRNLGSLIGRRGETLDALQYVTRLIASRELGRRANIVVDVEGYKSRRETMLKRLAKRMAEQALQRGRSVALEPMPPNERRIIHLTLRDNPDVTTESVGEGDRRKVTIVPRRSNNK
jgi:spoIIIJ-associated protein